MTSWHHTKKVNWLSEFLLIYQKRSIVLIIISWTIFGPLLFLICINDLFRSLSKLTPVMFADDTNLFISDSNIGNFFQTMNEELRKVANWFKGNKLSLNISKTKYSLFHSTKKENIYQISYLHCALTTFQSKENSSQSFLVYP